MVDALMLQLGAIPTGSGNNNGNCINGDCQMTVNGNNNGNNNGKGNSGYNPGVSGNGNNNGNCVGGKRTVTTETKRF